MLHGPVLKSMSLSLVSSASQILPSTTTTSLLTTTALAAVATDDDNTMNPRTRSVIYMAAGMSLHFGGYEFLRNACLSLFTSKEFGFAHPAAFPLAQGLVSPFSVLLLWAYSRQLESRGPRGALRNTTLFSVAFIGLMAPAIQLCQVKSLSQAFIGLTFLYQNSFQYLIYTQQWSFVGSVLTPDEGARWFATLAGVCSVVCSITGSLVPVLVPRVGLLGLMATTCLTLTACHFCSDRAYALAQKHDFDPSPPASKKTSSSNKFRQAVDLFRRTPTLSALFLEVLSFQSLNTILNIAFVRTLQQTIPDDLTRSSYTGRFYSLINGASAALQFGLLPLVMKRVEPAWIWRVMPVVPFSICAYQAFAASSPASLTLIAAAFYLCKLMDYSLRSVVYPMAYQPLDFESRYVGKEIIGVFGSRFGKSGMSILLSALTAVGWTGLAQLNKFSLIAIALWTSSTFWLSNLIPKKAEAQATVEKRNQDRKQD